MADFTKAITFVLGQEDAPGAGIITKDSDGLTRYGLLDRWHAELAAEGFYAGPLLAPTMPNAEALPLARAAYQNGEWAAIQGDKIADQVLATALLSLAVNDGAHQAICLLQQALGFTSDKVDGAMGPLTLTAINASNPTALLKAFLARQQGFYLHIEAVNPAKRADGAGWRNRIDALPALASSSLPAAPVEAAETS